MVPQARQICSQGQEFCALSLGYGRRLLVARNAELIFKTRDFPEPFVPPPFEIAGNQTVFRINRIILPVGASRFVARLLQRQLDLLQSFRAGALTILDRLQRGIKAERRNQRQYLGRNCGIDAYVTKCDTLRPPPVIDGGVVAKIPRYTPRPVMQHLELASAMSTAQQSNQQSAAIPDRSRHHLTLHIGIPVDGPLVVLIVLPRDIALMVITNQHLPFLL